MITLAISNNYICYSYHASSVHVEFAFLFLQVIISSILSIPSVFSQLPTLPLLGQNSLSSNQSSTCFFFCVLFWLPVAFSDLVSYRERKKPLDTLRSTTAYACCIGARRGTISPYALHCSTSLAGTTSTSYCNLSQATRTTEGQASVSLTARSLKARKQPWLLQLDTSQVSIPFFLTARQKESHPWGCFQWKRKSISLY